MNDHTVKLSGHSKDRFLERFFAAEPGLDAQTAARLTARSKSAFTSLRVRKALLAPPRRSPAPVNRGTDALPIVVAPLPHAPSGGSAPHAAPAADPASSQTTASYAFDAYAIGLVPVFQREGRDGLLAKLATVGKLEHLRQMSKAQQVILPQALRTGNAPLDEVRNAIADAVAKRIADRRAAAG